MNLAAAEGHPALVMDMSFANQALSAEWVIENAATLERKVYDVPTRHRRGDRPPEARDDGHRRSTSSPRSRRTTSRAGTRERRDEACHALIRCGGSSSGTATSWVARGRTSTPVSSRASGAEAGTTSPCSPRRPSRSATTSAARRPSGPTSAGCSRPSSSTATPATRSSGCRSARATSSTRGSRRMPRRCVSGARPT